LRLVGGSGLGSGPNSGVDERTTQLPDGIPSIRRPQVHAGKRSGLAPSRLVLADDDRPLRAARTSDAPERSIARENREASINRDLDPRDPRWQVALETASRLEGSLLTFERRRAILAFAAKVGVRPFDANLIIAAVQDRARRGEPLEDARSTVLIAAPVVRRPRRRSRSIAVYATTAILAIAAHAALAWYLVH
jgi:hypothetical protein